MAKDAPTMQNTKLLLIALGLALIVVVIYNVHINRIRSEGEAGKVKVLKYNVQKNVGEQIGANDIVAVDVNQQVADGISNRLPFEEMIRFQGRTLARNVQVDDWVMIADVAGSETDKPSGRLKEGFQMVTVPIDRSMSFGKILRVDDIVNLWGYLDINGQWQATPIVNGLRVYAIGGRSVSDASPTRRPEDDGVASFQEIQVPMPKETVGPFFNVRTHCQGRTLFYTISKPDDKIDHEGVINPAVPAKYKSAAAAVPGYDPNTPK